MAGMDPEASKPLAAVLAPDLRMEERSSAPQALKRNGDSAVDASIYAHQILLTILFLL